MTTAQLAAVLREQALRRERWLIADAMRTAIPAQAWECGSRIESIDAALVAFGYERTEDKPQQEAV